MTATLTTTEGGTTTMTPSMDEKRVSAMPRISLHTRRLLLREFEETDWQAAQEYAADPEAVRYRPFGPCTDDETQAHVRELARQASQPARTMYDLAIIRTADDRLIGGCDLGVRADNPAGADIGYILSRAYWGQGYATEAVIALVAFGFEQLGVARISAAVVPDNVASSRVLEKVGMRRIGQGYEWMKGRQHPVLLYEIAADHWQGINNATRLFP